jgi:hypothetical protein
MTHVGVDVQPAKWTRPLPNSKKKSTPRLVFPNLFFLLRLRFADSLCE